MNTPAEMKSHYLSMLFTPRSVVVVGASETPDSVGARVFRNLLDHGYQGKLFGVNLRHPTVFGRAVWPSLAVLPEREPDLAIIATPARTLPALMRDCIACGVKSVLVLSRDFVAADEHNRKLLDEALQMAGKAGVRVLGPNLLGLMRPGIGLVAANYHGHVRPGALALVVQSSSVASAMLDWADGHEVGFSTVVSLGAAADVNFAEVLDFLVEDRETSGILLYIEDVGAARPFMSALRAASRSKPVVVLKVGRHQREEKLARTHSERLVGRDDAFDAAMRRAGVLRVQTMIQMATAARMLATGYRVKGRRLAIVSNGFGAGRMAVDRALDLRVQLPSLDPTTVAALDQVLPRIGTHNNPVDILGDAPPERFEAAVRLCLNDPNIDGVMVIFTPQAGTDHLLTAEKMIALRAQSEKLLMVCWLGEKRISLSRKLFERAKLAYFITPEQAVEAFASLSAFQFNQMLSLQTPGPLADTQLPDLDQAHAIVSRALAQGRSMLDPVETEALLKVFRIPFLPSIQAASAEAAVAAAERLGYPVAVKLDADGVLHKTDLDGVALNLADATSVASAANRIMAAARLRVAPVSVRGVTVQRMHDKSHGRELMAGAIRDSIFGPLVTFGSGGVSVEVFGDVAVALPPLNALLANNLIRRTRVKRALGAFRNVPAIDMAAVEFVLLRLSELVCELPEVVEVDLNPLVADENGAIAVDASILVEPTPPGFRRYDHMAIYPYPSHLVGAGQLRDGTPVVLRPIRPEDADEEQRFVREEMSMESRFNRFLASLRQLPKPMLVRFTQLDYSREMALVATAMEEDRESILGVARYTLNPDWQSAEFAIAVGDRSQGQGLGSLLMNALFAAARDAHLDTLEGEVLGSNTSMLALMRKLGFAIHPHPDDPALKWVVKSLNPVP
ncbi:bifunctional acetate--CoA ligase family protein/GNAT family N-acetyltransferase [Parachitinimonas caeni]|uniref:Bifunctional acetate--CoA ligase family protein/GNAT family N-acetyltransferase n=1 Tax=Parachitinimonas caeni TaxID=3031301 RepID=A0ABT7DUQ0_9NEIS|nr:bifunctional acetate--CoA ligase family protein/GNAT family N-acetyltransferase [Parachitinimonas caeni]MDK2123776.1 bifunctional acetate--CoA ligase family protein/GNAT family N-acetyltransferase [Parachitinimonas caeni]